MAITYVGAASAASTSVSLPTFQAGDVAIVIAFNNTNTTIPSLASGWTSMEGTAGTSRAFRAGYRILQTGDTTTGAWTNATHIGVVVYRGQSPILPFDGYINGVGWTPVSSLGTAATQEVLSHSVGYGTSTVASIVLAPAATNLKSAATTTTTNRTSGLTNGFFGVADKVGSISSETLSWDNTSNDAGVIVGFREATTFPIIADQDTKSGTVTSNSSSWTLTYPTNIAAGDLLLALIASDGDGAANATPPANWISKTLGNGHPASISASKYVATGSETGTFTWTMGSSEQGAWVIYRIPAGTWGGTLGTTFSGNSYNATDGDVSSSAVSNSFSTSANPDPPSANPYNWATEDTLWISAASVDTSRTFSAFPTTPSTFTNTGSLVSGGSGGASLGYARLESAAASVDPGTFTISSSDDWAAVTIAIRPAASVSTISGSFAANAVLFKTITPTAKTIDAVVLRNSGTKSFSLDAVVRETINQSFTVAATIFRPASTVSPGLRVVSDGPTDGEQIIYVNGQWVALTSETVRTSPDGVTWTSANLPTSGTDTAVSICYDPASGKYGYLASENIDLYVATDPLGTWTWQHQFSTQMTRLVAADGYIVATGTGAAADEYAYATSLTGTWTQVANPGGGEGGACWYANSRWVFWAGYSLYYASSPDAALTAATMPESFSTGLKRDIAYGNGTWLTCLSGISGDSESSTWLTSTNNGVTWSISSMPFVGFAAYGIAFELGKFWVSSTSLPFNSYASSDLATWTMIPAARGMLGFASDGAILRAISDDGDVVGWIGFTVDAQIVAAGAPPVTGSFAADAVILANSGTKTFTANAIALRSSGTLTFTANATAKKTQSSSFTANAILWKTRSGSFTANAVIFANSGTKTFAANAVALRSASGSFTASSLKLRTGTGSITAAAVIKGTQASSFAANAIRLRTFWYGQEGQF